MRTSGRSVCVNAPMDVVSARSTSATGSVSVIESPYLFGMAVAEVEREEKKARTRSVRASGTARSVLSCACERC